jgi:hypothetical protein
MDDIKRLSALLIASSMFMTNMTCAVVSADEIPAEENQSSYSETIGETEQGFDEAPVETPAEEVTAEESENTADEEVHVNEEQNGEAPSVPEENTSENNTEQGEPVQNEEVPAESGPEEASAVNKGKGDIEGLVNTKVFQVTLPVKGNGLDYVADPQGLIRKTNAAKHPDSVYDNDSNVYFNNGQKVTEDGRTITAYSGTSDPLTVVNKSSSAVTVVARVSAYYEQGASNPVALAGSRDFTDVSKPSICLSVVRSDDGSETVLTQREQVISASIPGCPGAYKYVYEQSNNGETDYGYRLMTDEELQSFRADAANTGTDTTFKEFSLCMTGACNSDGEWKSDVNYSFPTTSVVWNVGFAVSARPCINNDYYTVAYSSEIKIPYSLGLFDAAATGIASAEFISQNGSVQINGNGSYFSSTDNEITLTSDFAYYAKNENGGILRVTFNDPQNTSVDITLDNSAAPSLDETECHISMDDKKVVIPFSLGAGEKAASGVTSVKFGNSDFSSSAYSSVNGGSVVLSASAVRTIQSKGGGKVYVTFDDPAHTRCGFKVIID